MQTAIIRYLVALPAVIFVGAAAFVALSGYHRPGFDLPFNAAALAFGIGALAVTLKMMMSEIK